MLRGGFYGLLLSLCVMVAAEAVFVEQQLEDPAEEQRAREISEGIRCLVCQNQSILDSGADLAKDLRQIVRERISAGDSDDQVREFLVVRYGDWVLLDPPFNMRTALLWFGPLIIFLVGLATLFIFVRRRSVGVASEVTSPLSAKEAADLDNILVDDEENAK
ncbi:MAG: cytochrome C biogenesis protein CcmH [Sneathiella sp.]|nr:MAG: cytochrome C biogenesis protein CcmH [Sneathiella sp.]